MLHSRCRISAASRRLQVAADDADEEHATALKEMSGGGPPLPPPVPPGYAAEEWDEGGGGGGGDDGAPSAAAQADYIRMGEAPTRPSRAGVNAANAAAFAHGSSYQPPWGAPRTPTSGPNTPAKGLAAQQGPHYASSSRLAYSPD